MKKMRILDLTLPALVDNLALDEALLLQAEDSGLVPGESALLRFWEWPSPAVVLGAGARFHDDVAEESCRADGVPLARRSSGGGTVLLGPGCLLYSLILPFDHHPALADINASYRHILAKVASALSPLVPDLEFAGTCDLARAGRKCSGNAQQRKRTHLLHHGTLLHNFDLELIPRYLKLPTRQPPYRQGRGHLDFLLNLKVEANELKNALRNRWQAEEPMTAWPKGMVKELLREKYQREDWLWRR